MSTFKLSLAMNPSDAEHYMRPIQYLGSNGLEEKHSIIIKDYIDYVTTVAQI